MGRKFLYTVDGVTGTLKEICAYFHKSEAAIRKRMFNGMTLLEALQAPDGRPSVKKHTDDQGRTIIEIEERQMPAPEKHKPPKQPEAPKKLSWIRAGSSSGYYDYI